MFGSSHPQPPHRREVAMQIVRQQRNTFAATELTVDMPGGSVDSAPVQAPPLRFSVACTLGDYLGMVGEHVRFLLRHAAPAVRRRRVRVPLALGTAACALALGAALVAAPAWVTVLLLALGVLAFASLPAVAGLWVALLITPLFFLTRRRAPVNAFTIDHATIARRSRRGEFLRGWDQVTGVRSYRRGYLLVFARGALPIPFRCLDSLQLERLRVLALARPAAV
jgi:hypothetical protein